MDGAVDFGKIIMCGIAGIFSNQSDISPSDLNVIRRMNDLQRHRGPDDDGVFSDPVCVLGHRRLSIIDLSRDGHQPFFSEDGRFVLVYNGEIYNYLELREELTLVGWKFRTKTDTEVLLKAFQEYGPRCLSKFNGMFAFVIYDTKEKTLFFARDRVGVKPLYYRLDGPRIYFASEIKALRSIPSLGLSLNEQAVFDYLTFSRTDIFDETFLNEIKRIPKGHYGLFDQKGLKLVQWWDPHHFLIDQPRQNLEDICPQIESILSSAVSLRLRSDVPVGSCLSGGLDSSLLTGILFTQHKITDHYATFTASMPGHAVDETRYVDCLNKKYPFKNYRTFPTAQKAFENFRDFVYAIDEPCGDATFYSQYEVMRLAKENGITVLLDGQGGDEVFAGYPYFLGFYLYGMLKKKNLAKFSYKLFQILSRGRELLIYQTLLFQLLPDRLKKRFLLKSVSFLEEGFFKKYIDTSLIYNRFFDADGLNVSLVRHLQYKLEHLLRLEDRNSMAFSLEARLPYLDYRLIEYVLGVSEDLKVKDGQTKYLQKLAVGKYTVDEILKRTDKIGFGTPTEEWMSTSEWEKLTRESYEDLSRGWPGIFKKNNSGLPVGLPKWKINQLAVWKRIVFY